MTSAPIRDPLADHLITPRNTPLPLIECQPAQLAAVHSMGHALLMKNAVLTVKTIKTFGVPVVPSTINVASGHGPTLATRRTLARICALFGGHVPVFGASQWEEA
jgi:hypothetical protein